MLSKFSIRAKIIAVVAFLLVVMSGMGLLAVVKMRALNASTVDITTDWLPSIRLLGELRAGVITYRNVLREHMLSETMEEKLAAEKILAGVVESNSKVRQTYEGIISSPEERAIYNDWVKTWDDYKAGAQKVMELSRKTAGQTPHDAHELNKITVNKLSIAADEILKKDIDLNNTGADKETRMAADNYASTFLLLSIILVAVIIIGVAVSFFAIQDITRGIASIITPMQALGKGELAAEVPHRGEKTEIGAMADTLAGVQGSADRQESR